ncbi:hypothetical protein [Leadbettera azotonutricia]|uniref:Uncharacterized protein n=1 Tax=Leadbettera azotonutricia (strain ATCC BAA-888 / DSM 13862 / ZAS-9) TaxID=545695 RepID=F5Y748_LEAAZ|nr:hypothetical protein [Leadbettera azotonutricia]AEF82043.1 hypothetical protein TREAZ_1148 [Leadbettera azotonutricia ZAS-9]
MNDVLPQTLEPVRYFLETLNSDRWFWVFRIAFAVCMVFSAVIFIFFRKRLPNDEELARKKKKKKI